MAIASSANAAIERVDVTGGSVKGQVVSGVASFKGIPFAAPPVGALRWKKPRPVVAWSGVRNADAFAPACMQPWGEHETSRPNEDCLYPNVWTSAASAQERRPVVVWIHGGGLTGGMTSEKVSEGSKLASESTQGRGSAYVYFFDVHGDDRPYGAPHATEYPYVFGNFPDTATAKDRAVSDVIRKYLVNFATTGDPNGSGLPAWKKFDEASPQAMVFDDASSSRPWPSLNGVKAMDGFLSCWLQLDQDGEQAR